MAEFSLEDVASIVDNEGLYYAVVHSGLRSDRVPEEIRAVWHEMEEHMIAAQTAWESLEGILPEPWGF